MKVTALCDNWKITYDDATVTAALPYDCLPYKKRDHYTQGGNANGFYPLCSASFVKTLPPGKHRHAKLSVSGVMGVAEIYINDSFVAKVSRYSPTVVELGDIEGLRNTVRIDVCQTPGMSQRYTGLGIAGDVQLIESVGDVEFIHNTLFCSSLVDDRALIKAEAEVANYTEDIKGLLLVAEVYNHRGKRVSKKHRKIRLRALSQKKVGIPIRMTRFFEWSHNDGYTYTLALSVVKVEEDGTKVELDKMQTTFGIVDRMLHATRGLYINKQHVELFGAVNANSFGTAGGFATYNCAARLFETMKESGMNSVRFIGCPVRSVLDAADDCGMYSVVDLFDGWRIPKAPLDGHLYFDDDWQTVVDNSVKALRNHPSVIMYSLGDAVQEAYGRAGGYEVCQQLYDAVKQLDPTRPITTATQECVPTLKELENVGMRLKNDERDDNSLINAGREKQLYSMLTAPIAQVCDVVGYNYLYSRYQDDKKNGKPMIGLKTKTQKVFDAMDECEKEPLVLGDFAEVAQDCFGDTNGEELFGDLGEIDVIGTRKPSSHYREIISGAKNKAYICAVDPVTGQDIDMWNFPRWLGQSITVRVYTRGEVVALYADGKIVGRKLAGRVNKYVASFKMNYYPCTLEAVCFYRGMECARAKLAPASGPKQIKLVCKNKSLNFDRNDLAFVEARVCDKEGNIVPYAVRNLTVTVEGDAELVSFMCSDPTARQAEHNESGVYRGKALAVVRATRAGRATVRVTGESLTPAKITLKIKSDNQ